MKPDSQISTEGTLSIQGVDISKRIPSIETDIGYKSFLKSSKEGSILVSKNSAKKSYLFAGILSRDNLKAKAALFDHSEENLTFKTNTRFINLKLANRARRTSDLIGQASDLKAHEPEGLSEEELMKNIQCSLLTSEVYSSCMKKAGMFLSSDSPGQTHLEDLKNSATLSDKDIRRFYSLFQNENIKEIQEFCLCEKEESLKLQKFLEKAPRSILITFFEALYPRIKIFLFHPRGTYVVQKLITLDESIRRTFTKFASQQFWNLTSNEYASRTLQVLATIDEDFRFFSLREYRSKHPSTYSKEMPGVFFLCSLIKLSWNSPKEFKFVLEDTLSNPHLLLNRRFKRILVSFVDVCPYSKLEVLFRAIPLFNNDLVKGLEEKYLGYLFLAFLNRQSKIAIQTFFQQIKNKPCQIFSSKMLGMILLRFIKNCLPDLLIDLLNVLTTRKVSSTLLFSCSKDVALFYCYIILDIKMSLDTTSISKNPDFALSSSQDSALSDLGSNFYNLLKTKALRLISLLKEPTSKIGNSKQPLGWSQQSRHFNFSKQ